jgi:rhamnogalacturonan endolyase
MESNVKLKINGLRAELSNEIITIKFDENANVYSLCKNQMELVKNLSGAANDPDKDHSFYVDYHAEGKFRNIKVDALKIICDTTDEAHIVYHDRSGLLAIEYHIILKRGESGIYSYVIAQNNARRTFKLSELRTVYRLDSDIFDVAYTAERRGRQPVHAQLSRGKKIQDETYELSDGEKYTNGKIYSKYDYAGYFKDNSLWGQYGHGFGFWFIPASKEYYPSGPMKQELLVHYNAITLNYMTGAHFGTGDFYVQPDWKKIYGPWFVYINSGTNETVIQDALVRAGAEEKKWPYKWMKEKLYPTQRCTVQGRINGGGESSGNMMVVLAKPNVEILRQRADYIFYTQADKEGSFSLENVRPGEYELYAYATHGDVTETLTQGQITISQSNVDLGEIKWCPMMHAHKLWQIGEADRTSGEFMFGSELRNYKWHQMIPKEIDFVIGSSQDKTDWYYAQTKPGDWRIHFTLQDVKDTTTYYLTVAMAAFTTAKIGTQDGSLVIKVNECNVKVIKYPNDQAVYRSAMKSGRYHREKIKLNASYLHTGENTITLVNHGSAIMYDTILLERD